MMSRLYSKGAVSDLILMDKISDEEINSNLKRRFNHDDIYTYIGPVLLSVNPFKMISGLYGDGVIRSYIGRFLHERPPHVYALAHDAYRTLKYDKENQCIIISGESGAGKTEASKFILHFISAVSRSDRSGKIKKVKEKILSSNPVLESFGNAKTLRNDNSSRFGKYMTLMFDHSANPVGGTVQNYLLEKSRVVNTAMGER